MKITQLVLILAHSPRKSGPFQAALFSVFYFKSPWIQSQGTIVYKYFTKPLGDQLLKIPLCEIQGVLD